MKKPRLRTLMRLAATLRFGRVFALVFVACGPGGATGNVNFADDPDLGAVRAAFHCSQPQTEGRSRACAAVARFEQAGPVVSVPAAGRFVFLGRRDCSDDDRGQAFMTFSLRGIRAGSSSASATVDGSHGFSGSLLHAMSSFHPNPPIGQPLSPAALETMDSLRRQAAVPMAVATGASDLLPKTWQEWANRLDPTPLPSEIAKSDGRSLLEGPGHIPAFWDDAPRSSAFGYLREIENELIYVSPPSGLGESGAEACVEHLWRLPGVQ